jgi:hypothetical protein
MPRTLPRLLGLLVVLAATIVGLLALSDATKFQGQHDDTGSTRVEFSVDTKNYHHDEEDAAASLWYACVGAVSWEQTTQPEATATGTFVATVSPALGEDSRRRFRGCLEDASVERISGHVVEMTTLAQAA